MKKPRKSRQISLGSVAIGGGAPVSIQSMTNTDTRDVTATNAQVNSLVSAGCQIVRLAVPDQKAVDCLPEILSEAKVPIVADIHFDYRIALGAIAAGVHGIRLNPGNIGGADRVRAVAEAAGEAGTPIRVGANSGSLPAGLFEDYRRQGLDHESAMAESLSEAALEQCHLLEQYGFQQIKVSMKASSVTETIAANRLFAERSDYPLHLGVTEAGTLERGTVKSAIGIGTLLLDGLGDTIRVSLTADPVEEVRVARLILESVGLRDASPEIISCPTCGRTQIDLIGLTSRVEELISQLKGEGKQPKLKKLAVMGCVVNGPGEAKDADLGIAGGKDKIVLFRHGQQLGTYPESEAFDRLRDEILKSC